MLDLVLSMLILGGMWGALWWMRRQSIDGLEMGRVRLGPVLLAGASCWGVVLACRLYMDAAEGAAMVGVAVRTSSAWGLFAILWNIWFAVRGWFGRRRSDDGR